MLTLDNFHDYQWEGLAHLHLNPFAALFYDAGLGKTVIGLTYAVQRIHKGLSRRALVSAPIRVAIQTWPNEIDEWAHLAGTPFQLVRVEDDDPPVKVAYADFYQRAREGGLTELEVEVYRKMAHRYQRNSWIEFWTAGLSPVFPSPDDEARFVDQTERFCEMARTTGLPVEEASRAAGGLRTRFKDLLRRSQVESPAPLHFINREQLPWLVNYLRTRQEGCPYDDLLYDESSDLGDHNTERFKAVKALRPYLKSLVEMTATPTGGDYVKLFSQIALLDKGERWGLGITRWRNEHFDYNERTYSYKLKKGHDKILSSQIADIALVAEAKDHLPAEATTWTDLTRRIELGPELRDLEREMIETSILRMGNHPGRLPDDPEQEIEAETPAALSAKLLQFCSGAVYDENRKARWIHDHKIEELRQLQDELHGEPILLVYWWQSSLARLRKSFPKMKVMDNRGSQQEDWNKGKIKLLAVHPQGSEFGLNLQKGPGHDIAIFDMFWSYEKWYQIHKRLARQGQTRPVRSWPLVVRGSADEVAVKRLQAKEDAELALRQYIQDLRREIKGVDHAETKAGTTFAAAFD